MTQEILISLISLTALQFLLMIDNLIFVSILTEKLEPVQKAKARKLGLLGSLILNTLFILGADFLSHIHTVLFSLGEWKFTFHNLILTVGGLFLLFKTVKELRSKFDRKIEESTINVPNSLGSVVVNMIMIDALFSIDSTIIAIGMTNISWIQITSVLAAILIMFFSFNMINRFCDKYPSLKVLALNFLFLIGFSLFAGGLGIEIPKGFIYFAMAFTLGSELLNIKIDRFELLHQYKKERANRNNLNQ